MEDFQLDLIIGEGLLHVRCGLICPALPLLEQRHGRGCLQPLRDRFGIQMRMQFYTTAELVHVLKRQADKLEMKLAEDGAEEVAKRSRGTPRVAGRLRRVRDIALTGQSLLMR